MKKMTKREMYEQILAKLTDDAEREFIEHEIKLLDNKKEAKANRKPSADKIAQTALRDAIYNFCVELGEPMTITEMIKDIPECMTESNQKVTMNVTAMVKEGKFKRNEVKGKAYFEAVV